MRLERSGRKQSRATPKVASHRRNDNCLTRFYIKPYVNFPGKRSLNSGVPLGTFLGVIWGHI
ncbi:MAG: hypothetical protein AB4080_24920 [Trichodesmium sp.]